MKLTRLIRPHIVSYLIGGIQIKLDSQTEKMTHNYCPSTSWAVHKNMLSKSNILWVNKLDIAKKC